MSTSASGPASTTACTSLPDLFALELGAVTALESDLQDLLESGVASVYSLRLRQALELQLQQARVRYHRLDRMIQLMPLLPPDFPSMSCATWIPCQGDPLLKDAACIAQLQLLGHLGIAGYGTARTWSLHLHQPEAAEVLQMALDELRSTDSQLTSLAESGINALAAIAQAPASGPGPGSCGSHPLPGRPHSTASAPPPPMARL